MPADNINTAEVINVTAGREFAIVLPANPTTGYQWSLARAPDHVTVVPVTNIYIPKETARRLVGAGGEERWTFRALAPGRTRLTLHYARPWEKDSAPHDVRNYTVNVDAGSAGR